MKPPTTRRSPLSRAHRAAAVLLATAALLTGCATGDGMAASFTAAFAGDPDVTGVDLTSADKMAFTGGVSGTITVRDDAPDARVRDLSERVRTHGPREDKPVRIDLGLAGFEVPVLSDAAANSALLDVALAARADPRLRGALFSSQDYGTVAGLVSLTTADAASVFVMMPEAARMAATLPGHPSFHGTISDAARSVTLDGRPGPWVDAVARAWSAVTAQVAIASFQAEETTLTLRVVDEAAVELARSLVLQALDGTTMEVTVASDLITLFPGADGSAVRALVAQLAPEVRARIRSIWTNDESASFTVDDLDDAGPVAAAIAGAAPADLRRLQLTVGDPGDPTLWIAADPAALVAQTATGVALLGLPGTTSLTVNPETDVTLNVAATVSDRDFAAFAAPLKSIATTGQRLCIVQADAGALCMAAGPTISTDASTDWGKQHGRPFVDAWNSGR